MALRRPFDSTVFCEFPVIEHVSFDLKLTLPPAAIAFVQAAGTNNSPVLNLAVAYNNNVVANNLLLAAVGAQALDGAINTVTVTDGQGNTWTRTGAVQFNGTNNYGVALFWAIAQAGADTVTATFNASLNFARLIIHEFSGVSTPDQHAGATGSVYPVSAGSLTTGTPNELLFCWGVADNGTTNPGAGFTIAHTQTTESTEYQIVSTTGTYAMQFPGDGANSQWCITATTFA